MHIEFRHLRTIKAIHDTGSVAGAADLLNITQSALSHQIKGIEDQAGVELFVRRSKPLRLSAAGLRMLAAAERILPEVDALEAEFTELLEGSLGRLHIAVESAASLDWALPVLDRFRRAWPQLDLDLRVIASDPLAALRREDVDMVITTASEKTADIAFVPLFDYEAVLLASSEQKMTSRAWVEAEDFAELPLLAYPLEKPRQDVFAGLLTEAGVAPAALRRVEITEVILMLIAAGQGVAVLPDWVLGRVWGSSEYVQKRITEAGLTRRIHAAVRQQDVITPFVAHLLRLARQEAVRLQRR